MKRESRDQPENYKSRQERREAIPQFDQMDSDDRDEIIFTWLDVTSALLEMIKLCDAALATESEAEREPIFLKLLEQVRILVANIKSLPGPYQPTFLYEEVITPGVEILGTEPVRCDDLKELLTKGLEEVDRFTGRFGVTPNRPNFITPSEKGEVKDE